MAVSSTRKVTGRASKARDDKDSRDRRAEVVLGPAIVGIEIHTLGGFRVTQRLATGEIVAIPPSAWRHGRTLALAHYLISRPGFECSRDSIRDQLWPHADPRTANTYLSNALWNLRKGMGTTRETSEFLSVTPTSVKLHMAPSEQQAANATHTGDTGVSVDFLAFEAAARQAKNAQTTAQSLLASQQAIALYAGDFLPECSEIRWSFALRERLRERWAGVMMLAARAHIEMSHNEDALQTLDRLVCQIPDHEEGAVAALQLLMSQNRHREALVLYEHVRAFYKQAYRQDPPISLRQIIAPALTRKRTTVPLTTRRG